MDTIFLKTISVSLLSPLNIYLNWTVFSFFACWIKTLNTTQRIKFTSSPLCKQLLQIWNFFDITKMKNGGSITTTQKSTKTMKQSEKLVQSS